MSLLTLIIHRGGVDIFAVRFTNYIDSANDCGGVDNGVCARRGSFTFNDAVSTERTCDQRFGTGRITVTFNDTVTI